MHRNLGQAELVGDVAITQASTRQTIDRSQYPDSLPKALHCILLLITNHILFAIGPSLIQLTETVGGVSVSCAPIRVPKTYAYFLAS